jgi:hypothetical protein
MGSLCNLMGTYGCGTAVLGLMQDQSVGRKDHWDSLVVLVMMAVEVLMDTVVVPVVQV